MRYEEEYFDNEVDAIKEGERCKAMLGPGYGYTYGVYYSSDMSVWVLWSKMYTSCD
jgi:hypothetical protein